MARMSFAGLKDDAMDVGKVGISVLGGAVVAKQVLKLVNSIGVEKDAAGMPTAVKKDGTPNVPSLPTWIGPLAVALAGVVVYSKGRSRFPTAAPGVGAGMFAYAVDQLAYAVAPGPDAAGVQSSITASIVRYSPFAGTDVYDDMRLNGLGENYNAYNINRYLNGSPTQIQQMNGAPLQIQTLNGLAGAPVYAQTIRMQGPMSATLQ